MMRTAGWIRRRRPRRGFPLQTGPRGVAGSSLLEVMVASALVIIVFAGVSQYYVGGRRSIDYEENRRAATEFLSDRFERIRRQHPYDTLPLLHGVDTTYALDARSYLISHEIVADSPEANATTVRLTVSWTENPASGPVTRSMDASTILARGAL